MTKLVRAIAGEFAGRRIEREVGEHRPSVMVAFDPATATALMDIRESLDRPVPVVAIVTDLAPDTAWQGARADRFLTVDSRAAFELAEHGVAGHAILPIGPLCGYRFAAAGRESRGGLRKKFNIATPHTVLVDVDGLGEDRTGSLVTQLSLIDAQCTFLFDAGTDTRAAAVLRRQVPLLDIRAKLFGEVASAPLYWRCADVVITRATGENVQRAMVLGAKMVALAPSTARAERLAASLAARGIGASAGSELLVAAAVEPLLASSAELTEVGVDGAANAADAIRVVGDDSEDVAKEYREAAEREFEAEARRKQARADAASARTAPPGELEDLGGTGGGQGRRSSAGGGARSAPKSVDDMLNELKRNAAKGGGSRSRQTSTSRKSTSGHGRSSVDDELEALKRKAARKKRK